MMRVCDCHQILKGVQDQGKLRTLIFPMTSSYRWGNLVPKTEVTDSRLPVNEVTTQKYSTIIVNIPNRNVLLGFHINLFTEEEAQAPRVKPLAFEPS